MRGEYLHGAGPMTLTMGSPPLARGIQGNYTRQAKPRKDHPRLRGEYLFPSLYLYFHTGSPPLARGIPLKKEGFDPETGITPACAGNTTSSLKNTAIPWDHPRLRGEYFGIEAVKTFCKGSPPLARGIQICAYLYAK